MPPPTVNGRPSGTLGLPCTALSYDGTLGQLRPAAAHDPLWVKSKLSRQIEVKPAGGPSIDTKVAVYGQPIHQFHVHLRLLSASGWFQNAAELRTLNLQNVHSIVHAKKMSLPTVFAYEDEDGKPLTKDQLHEVANTEKNILRVSGGLGCRASACCRVILICHVPLTCCIECPTDLLYRCLAISLTCFVANRCCRSSTSP
jgi:hypothetical protein